MPRKGNYALFGVLASLLLGAFMLSSTAQADQTGSFGCEGKTNQRDIAIVVPTFTLTAYSFNSFYQFYHLYGQMGPKSTVPSEITTDLELLNTPIINHTDYTYPKLKNDMILANWYKDKLLRMYANDTIPTKVYIMTDEDIHNGKIINPVQPKYNKCDLVLLSHQEYVTQQEYDNLKKFVANGGKLLIMEGNVFFAEVAWNKDDNSITLVSGHHWTFDGTAASIGPRERWLAENVNWVGSLSLCNKCVTEFGVNPFNYKPDEEQYVVNHTAKAILNYEAMTQNGQIVTIASYEKTYVRGKVVMFGLSAHNILLSKTADKAAFEAFFERLVVEHALKNKLL